MTRKRFDSSPQFNVKEEGVLIQQVAGSSTNLLEVKNSSGNSVFAIDNAGTATATLAAGIGLPAGMLAPYAGTSAPTGWLLCAGQEVAISTYGTLYGVLGTTYGALTNGSGGAGSTHFRLPDMRGRVPAGKDDMGGSAASRLTSTTITSGATTLGNVGGAQTHTLASSEMPSHTHSTPDHTHLFGARANDNDVETNGVVVAQASYDTTAVIRSSGGSTSGSAGSGGAHNNVQPTIILNYIIKH